MDSFTLQSRDDLVEIDVDGFFNLVRDVIFKCGNESLVTVESIIIRTDDFDRLVEVKTIMDLVETRTPLFDYYVYKTYLEGKNHNVKISQLDRTVKYDYQRLVKCLFTLYFMILTRSKCELDESEGLPSFIRIYLDFDDRNYLDILTSNRFILKLEHSWIKSIKFNQFPRAIYQRLVKGIAGYRFINLLKENKPDRVNISDKVMRVYDLVINKFKDGIYLEVHPLFCPAYFTKNSLSKNLMNLSIKLYSDEKLKSFVADKRIYSLPKFDDRCCQYENWSEMTFSVFKTRIDE